jgi:hypothetical protein
VRWALWNANAPIDTRAWCALRVGGHELRHFDLLRFALARREIGFVPIIDRFPEYYEGATNADRAMNARGQCSIAISERSSIADLS